MESSNPPQIFASNRRLAVRSRMLAAQHKPDAPRYILDDIIEDVVERMTFLRHEPKRVLLVGDVGGKLAASLPFGTDIVTVEPARGFVEERPYPDGDFDLIASLGTLDTVNDLPGALVHIRNALAKGGLLIASFLSAGSLPKLRDALLVSDGERPAARVHPMVDVRAGAQLLQRTGFADPVADSRHLDVGFRSLSRAVQDLREQGLTNVLSDSPPNLSKSGLICATEAFTAAGHEGRTVERFEIITLSGWRR